MQINDDHPSGAPGTPGEAVGGSVRKLLDDLNSFLARSIPPMSMFDMNQYVCLGQPQVQMLVDELTRYWTEIQILRANQKPTPITHDAAEQSLRWIENFVHCGRPEEVERLRTYIHQQRDDERLRNR